MTISIKKYDQVALIAVCAARLINVEIFSDNSTEIVIAHIDCDVSQGIYLMIEFGVRIAEERQFNESCDRVGGSLNSTFDLLKAITRPNC